MLDSASTTSTASTASRGVSTPPPGGRGFVPLAVYETSRAVRHPAFVTALAVVVAAWLVPWLLDRSVLDVTVVNVEAMAMQNPMLLLATGAFLGAAFIALAEHRFTAAEMLAVVPVSPRARLFAQAVAALGPAGIVLILCVVRLWAVSAAPGAAGEPPLVGDVLMPSVLTLFAAVLATCCAHVSKRLAVCCAALSLLGVLTVAGAFAGYGSSAQGLMPIMLVDPIGEAPVPSWLLTRPAGLHATYIAALALLVLAVTALWTTSGRRRWLGGLSAVALVAVGGTGYAQVQNGRENIAPSVAWTETFLDPRSADHCETVGSDSYCAYPDFSSRIPYWVNVVSAQKQLLPPQAADRVINVHQQLSPRLAGDSGAPPALPWDVWRRNGLALDAPGSVLVSTRWARPGSDDYAQNDVLTFSVLTAATLAGWSLPASGAPRRGEVCGAQGVLTAWLATRSSPAASSAYDTVTAHTSGPGIVPVSILGAADTVVIGEHELSVADAVADLPSDQVSRVLSEHWGELTSRSTDVRRAAVLFGVPFDDPPRVTSVCAGVG